MLNFSHNCTTNTFEHYKIIAANTPAWFHYIIGIILTVATFGSIYTNGCVLFVFLIKDRKQLTRTNAYVSAICILSVIMTIFGIPMVAISSFSKVWIFGDAACKYYAFLMTFCGLGTMLILSVISVDRYIYIVKKNLSIRLSTKFSMSINCFCMAITLMFCVCPLLGWNQYTYEGVGTACAIDLIGEGNNGRSFIIALLVVFFAIPVAVMLFAYGSTFAKVIKVSNSHLRSLHSPGQARRANRLKMEHELAITICLSIGLFLICWLPYTILLFCKIANKDVEIEPMIMTLPPIFAKVGSALTPVVYLARFEDVRRQAFNGLLCQRKSITLDPQLMHTTEC